jgi:hypothetical protein
MLSPPATGNSHVAHHRAIKYLTEKILEPDWSILELGCAAGMMLAMVKDAYSNGIGKHGKMVLTLERLQGGMKHVMTHPPGHNTTLVNYDEVANALKGSQYENLLHRRHRHVRCLCLAERCCLAGTHTPSILLLGWRRALERTFLSPERSFRLTAGGKTRSPGISIER